VAAVAVPEVDAVVSVPEAAPRSSSSRIATRASLWQGGRRTCWLLRT
jgi:hypothetical protein